MISVHVRHRGHRSRLRGSRRCILWSKTGWSDSPHNCGSTPGLPLQTDSKPAGEKRSFTTLDLLQHARCTISSAWFCEMKTEASRGRYLHQSSPQLQPMTLGCWWRWNSVFQSGTSRRGSRNPRLQKYILNILLTFMLGCIINNSINAEATLMRIFFCFV